MHAKCNPSFIHASSTIWHNQLTQLNITFITLFLKTLLIKIRMICHQRFILIGKTNYIRAGHINIEQPIMFKQSFDASSLRYCNCRKSTIIITNDNYTD